MKIFRSISGIAAAVLLCTLLCSIEIEADRVQDEGQLPGLTLSHDMKSGHDHGLGVETMLLTDEEQDKDAPSPKMASAKAKVTMGKTAKVAATKKTNSVTAKVTSSVSKFEPETALVTSEHGRRLLQGQGGSAMLDKCDICYEEPNPTRVATDENQQGRIDADHYTTNTWEPEDASQKRRQACEIKDLGYNTPGNHAQVAESPTMRVQPCATLAHGSGNGNLEYKPMGSGKTNQGQCTENDHRDTGAVVDGTLYTSQWAYTRGNAGTRSEADKSSQTATHATANFPGSTTIIPAASENQCKTAGGGYLMSQSKSLDRRQSTPGSICFKDPDLLTSPTISKYDEDGTADNGQTYGAVKGATQSATVKFAIIDQNNYFDEDAGAINEVRTAQPAAHGHLQPYQAPTEIEVCINEAEQSKHFHVDERIKHIASLFRDRGEGKKPLARFRIATKSAGGTTKYTYKEFDKTVAKSVQQMRFEGTADGARSVCVKFDDKDFDRHGLSGKTAFGCKATAKSVTDIEPYDFPVTEKMSNGATPTRIGWNPAWGRTAIDAFYAKYGGDFIKRRPRVFGSSDEMDNAQSTSFKLDAPGMKVYPYNTRLDKKTNTWDDIQANPIRVASECSQKLEIEMDSSIQGSVVVDIRVVQKQQLASKTGSAQTVADKQFVYYSSSQTMINFAPYHTVRDTGGDATANLNTFYASGPKTKERLRGLAYNGDLMATIFGAKAQLQDQGAGGLGGKFGIPEKHAADNQAYPGTEKTSNALRLYEKSSVTGVSLTVAKTVASRENTLRVFKDVLAGGVVGTPTDNSRIRFSLTFKDETQCQVQNAAGNYVPMTHTPSAIEKRFFDLDWGSTDATWQNLQRFQLTGEYTPIGTSSKKKLIFGRRNTKKGATDIFYAVEKSDEVTMSGLRYTEVKELLENMKIAPTTSHNTHMCGQYKLRAVIDVHNMRSCGRHTETVEITAKPSWPSCDATSANTGKCANSYWDIAPAINKSVKAGGHLQWPKLTFRQAAPQESRWCESTHAATKTCNLVASKLTPMKVTEVVLGNEPNDAQQSAQIKRSTTLRMTPKYATTPYADATKQPPATPDGDSKKWIKNWSADREPDEGKGYVYVPDHHNANIPQLTWFSTLEIADLNNMNVNSCKGANFRTDVEAAISTTVSRWGTNVVADASYIKEWTSSYGNSGAVPNNKDDSYVACSYVNRTIAPGSGMPALDKTLKDSAQYCKLGVTNTHTRVRRYTVFPSFHAYALATNTAKNFGQKCEDCNNWPANSRDRQACVRSYKAIFGPTTFNSVTGTGECANTSPKTWGAAEFEKIRKYSQTLASIGENGIELSLRPALHQMDFSVTLQAFDFLDMAQKATTAASLYVAAGKDESPARSSALNNRDAPNGIYPLNEYSASGMINVIADTDWATNPKAWEKGIEWKAANREVAGLIENKATTSQTTMSMSFPKNLQDGVCESPVTTVPTNGGYLPLRQAKQGAAIKHCSFKKLASQLGEDKITKCDGTDVCSLARQNQDCSPSDGQDNRLVGMQLVLSWPGKLPSAERRDGPDSVAPRNTLMSISDKGDKATYPTHVLVGDTACDLYTSEPLKTAYKNKKCYFSDAYLDVSTSAVGGQTASDWLFANSLKETRRGPGTCYHARSPSAWCKGQLLLAKQGSCAAGKSDGDKKACEIVYTAPGSVASTQHVWTLDKLPTGNNAHFSKVKTAYKGTPGSDYPALKVSISKNWNTQLWNMTALGLDKDIAPRLDMVAWFATCSKPDAATPCPDTTSAHDSNHADILNKANSDFDGGRRMTVMTSTALLDDIRSGNEPVNELQRKSLKLKAKDTADNWIAGGGHPYGNKPEYASKVTSLASNTRSTPYKPDATTPATGQKYWVKQQKSSTVPAAVIDKDTKRLVSELFEVEQRMEPVHYKTNAPTSMSRTIETEINLADLFGDMHISDMTLHFEGKNSAAESSWKPINDLWTVGRYNKGDNTNVIISTYGENNAVSYGKANQPHQIMSNGFQMSMATDLKGDLLNPLVHKISSNKGDTYRPTTCTDEFTKSCAAKTAYQTHDKTLFLRKRHKQGLEARTLAIHGGDLAGNEANQARKLWIKSRLNHHITQTKVTVTVKVRSEAIEYNETPINHIRSSTKELILNMHPAASAPTMCAKHASHRFEKAASTSLNLCEEDMSGGKSNNLLSVVNDKDAEMSDWAVPSIVDKNEDIGHPLHYGVVAGTLDNGVEGILGPKTTPASDNRKPYDPTRGKMMEEEVYLTVRGVSSNDKIVLREYDEDRQAAGAYVIGMPHSECPAKGDYARRSFANPSQQVGKAISSNPTIGIDFSGVAKTKESERTPYSEADLCKIKGMCTAGKCKSAGCVKERREAQYKNADGSTMSPPGKSHRDGGNCFRIKVCEVRYVSSDKKMVCKGTKNGKFPRFVYQTPRSDADVKNDNTIEMYLTQFKEKTIAIDENGYAVRSAAQKIHIYKDPHISGEHVDWGNTTLTDGTNTIKFDWRYYTDGVAGGKKAQGMSQDCKALPFSTFLTNADRRVAVSSLYKDNGPDNTGIQAWEAADNKELYKDPYTAFPGDDANKCDQQLSFVPVKYLKNPIKFGVGATSLGTSRYGNVGVKVEVAEVERWDRTNSVWAPSQSSEKADFKWQHTDFAHRQHDSVGVDDDCLKNTESDTKCNVGIIKQSGQDGIAREFKMQYKPTGSSVDALVDKWKTCGTQPAEMRVTVKISVPRSGNIASSVVTQVETRTIVFMHPECGNDAAGSRTGKIEYTWPAPAVSDTFRGTVNTKFVSKDVIYKPKKRMVSMCVLANCRLETLKMTPKEVEFVHSSKSIQNRGTANKLNCAQYSATTSPTADNTKWQIRIGSTPAVLTKTKCEDMGSVDPIPQKMSFATRTIVSDPYGAKPSLNTAQQAVTQEFGKKTEQALRTRPLQAPYKTEIKPQFSCVEMKSSQTDVFKLGPSDKICQHSGYYSDPGEYVGFCAAEVKSLVPGSTFTLSDIEQRAAWSNNLSPVATIAPAGPNLPAGSIVVSEADIENNLQLKMNGLNPSVGWRSDCNTITTDITISDLEYGLETGTSWTKLVDLPAGSGSAASDLGKNLKAESADRKNLLIAGTSDAQTTTLTWQKSVKGGADTKSVQLKLNEVMKRQFFGRAQYNHILRAKVTFATKCNKGDGSSEDLLTGSAAKCASKMLFIVQSQRAGQWEFKTNNDHTVKMSDIAAGKTVTDKVVRKATSDDKKILDFYQRGRGIPASNAIKLAEIDAKFHLNTNAIGGFGKHHRFMSKYHISMTMGGAAPKGGIVDDLYQMGVYRTLINFKEHPVTSDQEIQLATTLTSPFDKTHRCEKDAAGASKDNARMKLTYGFSKTPSLLSSLDLESPNPRAAEIHRQGYAYFKVPLYPNSGSKATRFSYWSNFVCTAAKPCEKDIQTNPQTSTPGTIAEMGMHAWDNKKRKQLLQPELHFQKNAQTIKITLPKKGDVFNGNAASDSTEVAYLYTTGNTCMEANAKFKVPGTLPSPLTTSNKNNNCKAAAGAPAQSNVLVVKLGDLDAGTVDTTIKLHYMGSALNKYTGEYANVVRVHLESMVSCLDTFVDWSGLGKPKARPLLMINVRSNKDMVSREHATGSSVSHRIVFDPLTLETDTAKETQSVVLNIKAPLSYEANSDSDECSADQKMGITGGRDEVSKCWSETFAPLKGTRPEFSVVSVHEKKTTTGLEFTPEIFKEASAVNDEGASDAQPFKTKMFTEESTPTKVGLCSNKQNVPAAMKSLTLRQFTEQLITGKSGKDGTGSEQRVSCNKANPTSTTSITADKTFLFNTKNPANRFTTEALKASATKDTDVAIRCARKETMITKLTMDRRELLQCKDPGSMRTKAPKMANFGESKNAVKIEEDRIKSLIHYDYAVCASTTSARLGIHDERVTTTCKKHSDCEVDDLPNNNKGLSFCDPTVARCKKATLIGFSNCVDVRLSLNTRFNMWTGKAGKNGKTGEQCIIIPDDVQQVFDKPCETQSDSACSGGIDKNWAKLKIKYTIQCPIKKDASGKPEFAIGVFGPSNVESALKQTTDFLGMQITKAETQDISMSNTASLVSITKIEANTKHFQLNKGPSGNFNPDEALKLNGKWVTNFGLHVNMHTCKLATDGKFPKTSAAGAQCTDAGIELFPAALQWKFTKYDTTQKLNIDMSMTQFRSWMPTLTSKYFQGSGAQVMKNRKEWWTANKLPANMGDEKLLPTDGLVLSTGITNAESNAGIQTFIKTATVMRAPKQAYQKGSIMITSTSTLTRNMDKGFKKAEKTEGADPGEHMLADLILNWEKPSGQTWLSSKYLQWPKIGNDPRTIEKFLRQYAEESCTPNIPLYEVTSTKDANTKITTFEVDTSKLIAWNDAEKNCVCGTSVIRKKYKTDEGFESQDIADNRCFYEFSKRFAPVTIIKNGLNDEIGIQMLGGKTAQQTKACLALTKSNAKGATLCAANHAQILRYDSSGDKTDPEKLACKMDQGYLVTTSSIAMQMARGALADVPYDDLDKSAYRLKCSSAYNDVLPTLFPKGNAYPEKQSMKCRATDRRGSNDALILGSKVVNGMRGSRFSVQVETAIFDPNADIQNSPVCRKPILACKADNKWYVSNLPDAKTSASSSDAKLASGAASEYLLMTNTDDPQYVYLGGESDHIPKPKVKTAPSAVVESDYVELKYGAGSDKIVIHYDGSDKQATGLKLSWKSGTFHTLNGDGTKVQRLYARPSGTADGGKWKAAECKKSDVDAVVAQFKNGLVPGSGRKLLSHSGGDAATSTNAVATVAAPGASKDRRLLNYGHLPLEYYLPYSVSGGFSRIYQIDEEQMVIQTTSDQDANAVATSTVNVIRDNGDSNGQGGGGGGSRNNHHGGNDLNRHHDDHHHDDDEANSFSAGVWVMGSIVLVAAVICIIMMIFTSSRRRCDDDGKIRLVTAMPVGQGKGASKASKRNQDDFRLI